MNQSVFFLYYGLSSNVLFYYGKPERHIKYLIIMTRDVVIAGYRQHVLQKKHIKHYHTTVYTA